jgi:hypothetical protein
MGGCGYVRGSGVDGGDNDDAVTEEDLDWLLES